MAKGTEYRPDIDGLRAVAILGVLIYHLQPHWLSGGYVGVDVFFVISGFLITGILQRNLARGSFSLAGFYERRIRRIFPALFVVLAALLAAGWCVLLPADLVALAKSVQNVLAGIANHYFLDQAEGYFNAEVSGMPLLHTWSLAVEEQFYLIFPLGLWLIHRLAKSRGSRCLLLGGLCAASLAGAIWLVHRRPVEGFFILPSRAWEMGLGALLAAMAGGGESAVERRSRILRHLPGLAGLAMIGLAMVRYDAGTPFPGVSALLPCAGAALVIAGGADRRSIVARLLAWRPIVFVGLISYSVYLWHWPLISLVSYRFPGAHGAGWAVFAASLLLGALSWRWVERPFRDPGFLSRRMVYGLWLGLSLALVGIAGLALRQQGFPGRYSAEVNHYLSFKNLPHRYRNDAAKKGDAIHAPVYGNPAAPPTVAVWGDSHSEALMELLDPMARDAGIGLKHYGMGALAPVPGVVFADTGEPEKKLKYSQAVLEQLVADPGIRMVILHARWSFYNRGKNEAGEQRDPVLYGHSFPNRQALEDYYFSALRGTIERLQAAGKRVVLVGPVPDVGFNVPDYLAKAAAAGRPVPERIPFPDFYERHGPVLRFIDSLPPGDLLVRIQPYPKLLQDGQLTIRIGGDPAYIDDDHLSEPAVMRLRDLFAGIFAK